MHPPTASTDYRDDVGLDVLRVTSRFADRFGVRSGHGKYRLRVPVVDGIIMHRFLAALFLRPVRGGSPSRLEHLLVDNVGRLIGGA